MTRCLLCNSCFSEVSTRPLPLQHSFRSRNSPTPHSESAKTRPITHRSAAEHSRYVMEVGVVDRPEGMDTLLKALEAQGQEVVSPDQRSGLHPLAIPLARGPAPDATEPDASLAGDLVYTCLLRWPALETSQSLPVVRMGRDATAVTLVARSTKEYLRRVLASEDDGGGQPGSVASALGAEADSFYVRGSVAASGLPGLNAWLTREGDMFPDVIESLVMGHLEKGDAMSAMITGEWYMKRAHFPGWARPYEFNAQLYKKLGRREEARDSSRVALYMPWWTLRSGFAAAASLAELPEDAAEVHRQLTEVAKASQKGGAIPPSIGIATKTEAQLAIEAAEKLMDLVAAGERRWDDIRSELADRYREGGRSTVADFIQAAI